MSEIHVNETVPQRWAREQRARLAARYGEKLTAEFEDVLTGATGTAASTSYALIDVLTAMLSAWKIGYDSGKHEAPAASYPGKYAGCGKPHCRAGATSHSGSGTAPHNHCRCERCHDSGSESLFPDLSGTTG